MNAKQPHSESRKRKRKRGVKWPKIEVEDHTDEATQEEIAEAVALYEWVQAQRAAGQKPN